MPCCDIKRLFLGCLVAVALGSGPLPAEAQVTRGFDTIARAVASGQERQRQPDLHIYEVQFKPMRILYADITDPKTGEIRREQIWYLAYRTANRTLQTRGDETDTTPVNELDPLPGPTYFIPEFTLLTFDQSGSEIPEHEYLDEVLPEAVAAINQIEWRHPSDPAFLNSVDVVQPLPDAVPSQQTDVDWIYGVATWRSIEPETDFLKVVMRGFSNGYELRPGPDGEAVTWRKTLVQQFDRRGDRFDPNQIEFEHAGPPEWTYLPDPVPATR